MQLFANIPIILLLRAVRIHNGGYRELAASVA